MIRFRRTFIVATLVGLAIGFALQRIRAPQLGGVGTGFPFERRLPALVAASGPDRLSGQVVDSGGTALPQVAVTVVGPAGVHSVWSGTDGEFSIDGLAPGAHEVHLVSTDRPGATVAVTVPSDGPLRLVAPDPWPVLETLPSMELAPMNGRIEPLPVGGATGYVVLLTPEGAAVEAGLAGRLQRRAVVGADGEFRVERLTLGSYRVSLLPPWAGGGTWPELVVSGFEHRGDGTPLRLPGSSAELVGRIVDQGGEAVAGALVTLRSSTQPERRWPSAETGSDGHFRIGDLPGGSYEVRVSAGRARFERSLRVPDLRSVTLEVPPLDVAAPR
ncbi:carboxypeptidase-like regulatory domain-containing protein [Engelhardtia mirabilis]|uniref:Cna protein B-type domain protein n=1 Tax=Engelhardtia mirabilis TaxID=2528011 RepID=A0A518BRU9_9BACT|nr:hypothetical protein Pla133_48250 [Planctomycetes bacterium Pla133]QDV04030.1 hypothetical protein Pla86_48230 [Planctomycetes bacterium Pla86]